MGDIKFTTHVQEPGEFYITSTKRAYTINNDVGEDSMEETNAQRVENCTPCQCQNMNALTTKLLEIII